MMDPRGARLSALAFLARVRTETVDYVGGLEMGAVPVIASLAAVSDAEGAPVRTFFVRKEAKGHGTREVVEGLTTGESLAGKRVLIADDVATTGGSIIKAVDAARAAGATVEAALVLIDRQEGIADRGPGGEVGDAAAVGVHRRRVPLRPTLPEPVTPGGAANAA